MLRSLLALLTALAVIVGQVAQASAVYAMVNDAAPAEVGSAHCIAMEAAADADGGSSSQPCSFACDAACSAPSLALGGGLSLVAVYEAHGVHAVSRSGVSRELDVEQRPPIT